MEFKNFTYLLLLLALIVIAILFGKNKKIVFRQNLKYLIPSIIFSGTIFILWDIRFNELGIWSFNPEYILGIYILKLPLEEWLFFVVMPTYCIYIFESLKIKLASFEKPNLFVAVSLVLLVIFVLIAYFARQKIYTFFTFFLLAIYFAYTIFRNRFKQYYTKFYLTYAVSLLLYLPLSVILTNRPIIEYNNLYLLGPRFFAMPVENFGYFFLLLLINTTIYEYLKQQRFY